MNSKGIFKKIAQKYADLSTLYVQLGECLEAAMASATVKEPTPGGDDTTSSAASIPALVIEFGDLQKQLAEIARATGKEGGAKILGILKKHGADKLSKLDPKHYETVLELSNQLL